FSSRRRHTRFSRDWSSDVCSSDLFAQHIGGSATDEYRLGIQRAKVALAYRQCTEVPGTGTAGQLHARIDVDGITGAAQADTPREIGRASGREREQTAAGAASRSRQ